MLELLPGFESNISSSNVLFNKGLEYCSLIDLNDLFVSIKGVSFL